MSLVHLTASTRETTMLQLLGNSFAKASDAFGEIADSTEELLHAQRQLRQSIEEAEQAGYSDSAAVRQSAAEGADALQWTAEQAVAQGRRAFRGTAYPEADDAEIPIAEAAPAVAMRAAVALYGQAAVSDVTPKLFAHITDGLSPDVADEVLAAVAEIAREEQHGAVLRRIRHVGLERLAAEGIAAELKRRVADGVPSQEISYFLDIVAAAWRGHAGWESARREFLDYLKEGGTSLLAAAGLLVAKMAADSLPAFVPLRESGLAELLSSRDQGVRATRPQPVLSAAAAGAPDVASLDDLSSAADRAAAAIMGQTGKPLEVRERELAELQRVLRGTREADSEGKAS
ncbi:MAG: hypothetical protein ACRDNS_26410 [Trebonia sp.]